jgi:ethanolamine permease
VALGLVAAIVFFATYLGYGSTLVSILAFYLLASVWFVLRRFKYVDRDAEFTAPLPRPQGY